jgi:hypothetical protein
MSKLLPPSATSLLESLRGVGYSMPAAIADLVDNSITAKAKNIWLQFTWTPKGPWIRILDDGCGMDSGELDEAMRFGGKSPRDQRDPSDLGRFGLGLKTASLSQCRRFTVGSKKADVIEVRRWDLDHLLEPSRGWELLEEPHPGSESMLNPLGEIRTGTLVLWEGIDGYLTGATGKLRLGESAFLKAADDVATHLAMVFHRFLEGSNPSIRIYINGKADNQRVKPWDPFLLNHPAVLRRPVQTIQGASGPVQVQGVVLPHKDKLSKDEFEDAGGPDGWTAQQGFYVYRNRRLLVAGDWLNLGTGQGWTKEESHKLARIRLDLPNSADAAWRIDIKKSVARPPADMREDLRRLAEDIRSTARRVFAHRGQYGNNPKGSGLVRVWKALDRKDGVCYRVDREHPSVRSVFETPGCDRAGIESLLRLIESTVPVQQIWLDAADRGVLPEEAPSENATEELQVALKSVYRNLTKTVGLNPAAAKARLKSTEPFNLYPTLVDALES